MSDKEVGVRITGDGDQAVAAMRKVEDAVKGGTDRMQSTMSGFGTAIGKVGGLLIGLAAAVGGGKFFKDALAESSKLTEQTLKLQRALGITAEEATTLNTALGDVYSDADTYIGMSQKLAMQLRKNEDGLKAMGLATRDSKGALREANDVMQDAIKLVGTYKPGMDQTVAAQKLFGKSIDDVMQLQRLNNEVLEEAKAKNEALGLVITDQNVAANAAYKASMNDVGDVMSAIMKTVGDALMPVFTELANYFASVGPVAISILKGALTGLIVVFRAVQAVIRTVAAVIFEFVSYSMDQISSLSELIGAVLSGDFERAGRAANTMKDRFISAFRNIKNAAVENFSDAQDSVSESLSNIWGPKQAATGKKDLAGTSGTKKMGDLKNPKEEKDSALQKVDAAMAAAKLEFALKNNLFEMTKAQELALYEQLTSAAKLSDGEKVSVAKKTSEMRLQVLRDERDQTIKLSEGGVEAYKAAGLDRIAADRQEAEYKLATGQITQLEMLQIDQDLEQQRYQITKDAIAARLELLKQDPTKSVEALAKLNEELAAVEREHTMAVRGIQMEAQKEQLKDWQGLASSIGNAFGNVVTGIITRTMTMGQAVRSLFQGLLASVAQFLAQMIAKKVAAFAVEKGLAMMGIGLNAAEAGSGAAKSVASIPYVGPVLALAAMATVFGAVMGMKGKASAKGGFDIPGGMNPLTQLHEREMVLPAEHADTIRNMSGSGGDTIVIATQGGDFIHKNDLGALLKKINRNFVFK